MKATMCRGRYRTVVVAMVGVLAAAAGAVQAGMIYVSAAGNDANDGQSWETAKATVQAGLNAAIAGDQVWVAAGTYVGCITLKAEVALYGGFAGTEAELGQRAWATNVTILDGNHAGSVVTAPAGTTQSTRIDGFTICNGSGTVTYGTHGGGIYCSGASPTIANNTITANKVTGRGGGMLCVNASPLIIHNSISGNSTIGFNADGSGGGIYCSGGSPTISGNTIAGNSVSSSGPGDGGGISCNGSTTATITDNTITGNSVTASGSGLGGGICCTSASVTITNNRITGNTAGSGGGICCNSSSSPIISNNTISGNSAGYGGAIYCHSSAAPTLANNTIASNSASSSGGGLYFTSATVINTIVAFNSSGICRTGSASPTLRYNCVYGNTIYNYSGLADPTGTAGNVSVDPKLADQPYGNVHIQPNSPCIDAGDDSTIQPAWLDMDGQPRKQGGHVDMGADESDGTIWLDGPNVIVRVASEGNDANDGSSWAQAKRTVQAGIDAAAALGGEVWVATGTYMERITLRNFAYVYGGFAGTETERPARDVAANVTILDAGGVGSVVTASALPGHGLTAVDGFVIRHGIGTGGNLYGGGIFCTSASPSIANNTITDNTGEYGGGGIYCGGGAAMIVNNTIAGNSVGNIYGTAKGGGIYCNGGSQLIANNTIRENTAGGYAEGSGGGMYCVSSGIVVGNAITGNNATNSGGLVCSSPTVANNIITGNRASKTIGGIYCSDSSPQIVVGNIIAGNSASLYAGGAYCQGSSVTLANNTIAGNSAPDGGGVYCYNSSPKITNTIIAYNSSGIYKTGTGTLTLRYNCVYNNTAYNYSGLADPTGTNGNIGTDPKLAWPFYVNVHIQPDSPCVDAGDDSVVQPAWLDMDGQARVQGSHVDIGADESDGTLWPSGGSIVVRVRPGGNDTNDGSSWTLAKRTVQAGINAVAASGGQVWVAAGTYAEAVSLRVQVALYGGFAGTETDLSQRNWTANQTLLRGNRTASVVTLPPGATGATRIDGFTIRDGGGILSANYRRGGGICCDAGSPVIANNRIVGNSADYGAGIYCPASASPTILNNAITGNNGSFCGGAIYCSSSSPAIVNNTITGNAAPNGGGVYCDSGSPQVTNSIVSFNSSGIYRKAGTPVLRYNCVYGNTTYNYSGLADPTGADGNIAADPRLDSLAYARLHIQPNSPCVDAGDDSAVQAGWTDIDGQARTLGAHADIGADESDGTTWPAGSSRVVRVSPGGSDANDGSSWLLAMRTVQAGIDAAASCGGQVWVAAGVYVENITLAADVAVYGGFAGDETSLSQRNRVVNVTVLDGNKAGSVVAATAVATAATCIDGFTIRNGQGTRQPNTGYSCGGGIHCLFSSPTISNNTISGNSPDYRLNYGGGIYCESSSPVITRNAIIGNGASAGAGIYCSNANPRIANNTISGNGATNGGGIYCLSSSPVLVNNTITANHASSGGGCYFSSSSPAITNTIVGFNSSGLYSTGAGTPSLRYNCVYGNAEYNYSGLADPTGSDGNIAVEPGLADTAYGNIHIQPGSACIDAGDGSAVPPGSTDVDGQSRCQGGGVDIGADESDGTAWPTGPYTIVRVSPSGNDTNDGSSWTLAKRTVQAGIDAAAAGGDVWVAAGEYAEHISLRTFAYVYGGFAGTEADRAARDWSRNVTVLDGGASEHVVTANWLGYETSAIDGFTILNGSYGIYCCASSPTIANNMITGTVATLQSGGGIGSYGGSQTAAGNSGASNIVPSCTEGSGVYCEVSSATIRGNTINANNAIGISCTSGSPKIVGNTITANAYGGISCTDAAPTITNNTITNNMAGGGIHCASGSATIAGNTITGNTATTYNGGGIGCYGGSQVITNNRIAGNTASNGSGGGIHCDASSVGTISNNAITGNSASYGGGIGCESSSSRLIANNTITANTASSAGGGLRCAWYSTITIANNTITGNSSLAGGGIHGGAGLIANTIIAFNSSGFCGNPATVLRCNCVYNNTAYNYLGLADPTGTDGNIGTDPKLAWPFYVNVHIQPDSPCIGAGDDSAVQAGWTDMDGQARVQGSHVDIGADESDGTLWPSGGSIVVRVRPGGSDANDGSSWVLAKGSVQAAIDAATATGGEVWVAAGTYLENVTVPLGVSIYGGFAGGETDLSQRDWATNNSILDGNQQGDVVTVRPGAVQSTRIDGFTIRNGSRGISCPSSSPLIANNTVTGNSGGGILCSGSPTITNNTITANSAGSGGGIYSSPGSPTITDNVITGNAASDGGGIYCNAGQPTIVGNTITDNTASSAGGGIACASSNPTIAGNTISGNTSAYHGGGIDCYSSPSALITNNTISGNSAATASGSGYGGAIYCYSGSPRIMGNTITGNDATAYNIARGGGIYASSSSLTIANNIIVGNRASSSNSTGDGGGIYCASGSPKIANNTVVGNTASSNGGGFYCSSSGAVVASTIFAFNSSGLYKTGSPAPTLRYNCVHGNAAYNYSGLTDPTGTNGNISADPRFVRAASPGTDSAWGTSDDDYGDLHLLPGSPSIDAGNNADVPADAADLDGDDNTTEPLPIDLAGALRFADDPYAADTGSGTAPIVDMGAYEHRCGDTNGDGMVDVVDLLGVVYAFGTYRGDATYDATCDFNADGTVDVVDLLDIVYSFGT